MCTWSPNSADNEDYIGLSQQFTFNSDNFNFRFTVPILNDDTIEPGEQFIVTVTTNTSQFPGVILDPNQAVVNIISDDGALLPVPCKYVQGRSQDFRNGGQINSTRACSARKIWNRKSHPIIKSRVHGKRDAPSTFPARILRAHRKYCLVSRDYAWRLLEEEKRFYIF